MFAWLTLVVLLFVAAPAAAQENVEAGPAAEQSEAKAEPPKVLSLPILIAPAGTESTSVEISILIDTSGVAKLESCEASVELCELLAEVLPDARFSPATRAGVAIESRVALRFKIKREATSMPETKAKKNVPQSGVVQGGEFSATGRRERPVGGRRRMELEEMRELPGAFGDPFRAIMALPGVTPVVSGLPYFYLRGAPPASTLYVYDGIPLPALYHLGLGPAIFHPRMIGPLKLYSGAAPARYGRLTGGVIEASKPEVEITDPGGEIELRLIYLTAYLETPVGDGSLQLAGRYGYPGLLLSMGGRFLFADRSPIESPDLSVIR